MKKTNLSFFIFFLLGFYINLEGQDIITLKNPSFEDTPHQGSEYYKSQGPFNLKKPTPEKVNLKFLPIKYWYDCGILDFPKETPPDIHSTLLGAWGVYTEPKDGKTFLGLVVRYNNSYEAISQKLDKKLKKNKCYSVSGYLALSDTYKSHTRRSFPNGQPENFNNPAQLRIWGGSKVWPKKELLETSGPVSNVKWQLYEFNFSPSHNYSFLTLEAYYLSDDSEAYNGNILVDDISPIREINCDERVRKFYQ